MSLPFAESLRSLAAPRTDAAALPQRESGIEAEVIGLFDEYRNPLLRYALSFGLAMQDGEEVIQEVFLALFRHLQLGRPRGNLRGWLFRVAHNLALKRRNANRRSPDQFDAQGGIAEGRPDTAPNPEEQVAAAQREARLLAIFNALPEQDRSCLRLRAEGLRYREIARVLGISLSGVSISLARSLARLMCADKR